MASVMHVVRGASRLQAPASNNDYVVEHEVHQEMQNKNDSRVIVGWKKKGNASSLYSYKIKIFQFMKCIIVVHSML